MSNDTSLTNDNLTDSIITEKYAVNEEKSWEDICERVSNAVGTTNQIRKTYYDLMKDKKLLPGGRILVGAGNKTYKNTLYNCFYIDINGDSLSSIFQWCSDASKTYSLGGGMGVSLEVLRPKGSQVSNAARTSTGGVSFSNLFSEVTGTIGQHGRRGALMITLPVDYPDIVDFITMKNDEHRSNVRYANISVKITDHFMGCVQNDMDFPLQWEGKEYGKISARKLFRMISHNAHASAEPGVLFWDTIKKKSPSEYCAPVRGTNPCSEIPLESGGGCLLASVNISNYVKNGQLDIKELENGIGFGVMFLDDCIDYSTNTNSFALLKQQKQAYATRRIGLSYTGLGDALIKCKVKYGSDESIKWIRNAMKILRDVSYSTSSMLAKKRGAFPLYDKDLHNLDTIFSEDARIDSESLKSDIKNNGLRNVVCNTIPPAGTISSLADCSSGIEPVYSFVHTRKSESMGKVFNVYHSLIKKYHKENGEDSNLPDYFVSAYDINYKDRIKVQSEAQKFIDQAISSTINLPETVSAEDIEDVYMNAWTSGLKGLSIYREGSREGILTSSAEQCFRCKKHAVTDDGSGCKRCFSCGNSSCEL